MTSQSHHAYVWHQCIQVTPEDDKTNFYIFSELTTSGFLHELLASINNKANENRRLTTK